MNDLVRVPPALMLRQLAFVMRASRALYVAAQLGVADILASGPMTSAELAATAGTDSARHLRGGSARSIPPQPGRRIAEARRARIPARRCAVHGR
jgi:hypothetical protein